jgi:hypothetical protein
VGSIPTQGTSPSEFFSGGFFIGCILSIISFHFAVFVRSAVVGFFKYFKKVRKTIDLSDMSTEASVNVAHLASGVYMVQLQAENGQTIKRLIKE